MTPPRIESLPLFLEGGSIMLYRLIVAQPTSPPVLFLHGWGLSPRSYAAYLEGLSHAIGADVLAPALPGFGGSDPLRTTAHADDLINHLHDAIDQMGLEAPPILAGHSLGAALAARLGAQGTVPTDPRILLISPAGVHHEGASRGVVEAVTMALDLRHELPHSPLQRLRDAGPSFIRHPRAVLAAGWTAANIDIRSDVSVLVERGAQVHLITASDDHVTPYDAALTVPGVHISSVSGTHGWVLSQPREAADLTGHLLKSSDRPA